MKMYLLKIVTEKRAVCNFCKPPLDDVMLFVLP